MLYKLGSTPRKCNLHIKTFQNIFYLCIIMKYRGKLLNAYRLHKSYLINILYFYLI